MLPWADAIPAKCLEIPGDSSTAILTELFNMELLSGWRFSAGKSEIAYGAK
jgi:hypothetical protein